MSLKKFSTGKKRIFLIKLYIEGGITMNPQNLNSKTLVIAVDNTSKKATLNANHPAGTSVIISNGTDKDVFVMSSSISSDTIVFPTSDTTEILGQIVLPGATQTFSLNEKERYIYAIQETAGTGILYITASLGV